ncbi:MAG: hypothetical protein WC139_00240 [Candidatus Kapaibacterium sp.]
MINTVERIKIRFDIYRKERKVSKDRPPNETADLRQRELEILFIVKSRDFYHQSPPGRMQRAHTKTLMEYSWQKRVEILKNGGVENTVS